MARLVDSHARQLGRSWIAGHAAAGRAVSAEGPRSAPRGSGGIAASGALVGYLILRMRGYDSSDDFARRQARMVEKDTAP